MRLAPYVFNLLVRSAVATLPDALRKRAGGEITALTREQVRRARRQRGILIAVAVATRCLADTVTRGLYERLRARLAASVTPPSNPEPMQTLLSDIRHAVRSLAKTPRFTAAVILILSLGIGANTAIFSVVRGVMLRPLPFPDAERFVHIAADYGGGPQISMPYYRIDHLRRSTRSFSALASYRGHSGRVEAEGRFEGVTGLRADPGFLDAVGSPLALGRWFTPDESAPDGPAAVVLAHDTWQLRFAGRRDVLGSTFDVSDRSYTVVGVLPASFSFPQVSSDIDYIVALALRPDPGDEGRNYPAIGRLADGATEEAARADLARAWSAFVAEHADLVSDPERGFTLSTFKEMHVQGLGRILWIMMGAVATVLLIACANVASLLMARANRRQREVALRAALGATRGRIVQYVMTESVLLAIVSAAAGLLVARWGVQGLLGMAPVALPRAESIGVDGAVLAFTAGWALLTGVLFGSTAALPVLRGRLEGMLREGTRGSGGGTRFRQSLILVQSALSVVLLVGAGLLLGTLWNLRGVDSGFDPRNVVAATVPVLPPGYTDPAAATELAARVTDGLVARPEVQGVAAVSNLPLERGLNIPLTISGRPDAWEGAVEWRAVTPGYFEMLEIGVLQGRTFGAADVAGGAHVVVVNESFAAHYFPDGSPLGQGVEVGKWKGEYLAPSLAVGPLRIVGVVADVRDRTLREEARRTVYVPLEQVPAALAGFPRFLAKGRRSAETGQALRDELQNADPRIAALDIRPLDDVVAASLGVERFNATLLAAFAALALVLTAFGIYGVIAYAVSQRTREIGIRLALGAARGRVIRGVVLDGMRPVLLGLIGGTLASMWLSRLVQDLVWGVAPNDPRTLLLVSAVLVSVSILATWLPARAVTRVDPVSALSAE